MQRRRFLAAMAAPLGAAQPARIRVAMLGGAHPHSPAKAALLRESRGWELAGIAEDDPAVRAGYEKAGAPLLSRRQVLEDPSIRVVAVGSAVKDHARDARQALEAGKHLHLEKPPATTMREYRILAGLAARNHLLVQMGYMWRHNPAIKTALEAARQGWLGEVRTVRGAIDITGTPEGRRDWALFKGGVLFEMGGHLLDPAVRLLGRPSSITPVMRKHGGFDDALADNAAVILEYPRALAVIAASALRPNAGRHRFFEIVGENGTAMVRPIEPPTLEIELLRPAGPFGGGRNNVKLPAYQRYADDFVELEAAVREGRPLSITPAEDLLVQETLLRACGM